MKNPVMALAIGAGLLAGCANTGSRDALGIQDPTVLQNGFHIQQSNEAGAVTPEWVAAHRNVGHTGRALDDLSARLAALPPDIASTYYAAKARCWVDAGRAERKANNQWGFVEEAVVQASRLTSMTEGRTPPSASNVALRTSSVLRADLWQALNRAKSDPRINHCPDAQPKVACAEVVLMHAGHEAWTRAFDDARVRADSVAAALGDIDATLQACTPPTTPAPLPEKLSLSSDALFGFDEGDESGLLREGRAALDQFIVALKRAGDNVHTIDIVGYTDRLGSNAYNERLSMERAQTIRAYLQRSGVQVPVRVRGAGAGKPLVECGQRERTALIACLAPNRRVEILAR